MKVIEGDMTTNCSRKDFVKKYAFSNRVIDYWNLLPASCWVASTVASLTHSRNTSHLNLNRKL